MPAPELPSGSLRQIVTDASRTLGARGGTVKNSEVPADVVGVWHPELRVDGQGALIVFASTVEVAERAVGLADPGQGAGLLVASSSVDGDRVGGCVVDEGDGVSAGSAGGFAEAVERRRFAVSVADFTAQVDRLPVVVTGVFMPAKSGMNGAEVAD